MNGNHVLSWSHARSVSLVKLVATSMSWRTMQLAPCLFSIVMPIQCHQGGGLRHAMQAGFQLANTFYQLVQIASCCLFFFDILGNFVTGYAVDKTMDVIEQSLGKSALRYLTSWFLFDVVVSLPWRFIAPTALGDHWIATTPALLTAMPLLNLFRILTLQRRPSYFSLQALHIKYAKRSIVSFVLFILVRIQLRRTFVRKCSLHVRSATSAAEPACCLVSRAMPAHH